MWWHRTQGWLIGTMFLICLAGGALLLPAGKVLVQKPIENDAKDVCVITFVEGDDATIDSDWPQQLMKRLPDFKDFMLNHKDYSESELFKAWTKEVERQMDEYKHKTTKVIKKIRLEGRTTAKFHGGTYKTEAVNFSRDTGCQGCSGKECIRVTGTLVATYVATTTVNLPRVSDYPNLSACQRRQVQDAIDHVLAPHEQEHVDAFHRYDDTTRRPFDLTLCRSRFESTIRAMVDAEEKARRRSAQDASNRLDPFYFEVELNCEESAP